MVLRIFCKYIINLQNVSCNYKSLEIKPIGLWHALHSAAYGGQVEIIDFLATKLDDILPYASNGWTPMHFGASNNQSKVIEYYLSSNKTIDKNPLHSFGFYAGSCS